MTTVILLASASIVGYAASYTLLCVAAPWGRCRRCHATGTLRLLGAPGGIPRPCPRCNGTGRRVRIGRAVYEAVRAERDRGTP